MHSVLFMYRHL
ncbi:hypothetical protein MAR_019899 [Mya arenaria]|uniref:Uncharacterized protein n=1 Tax=Mya arenaria TaxID=6604 RepID=A0ABY7E3V9_MYAAR|nr:hypothetical protein MAR_019899 [Mya arenaria]